MKAGAYAIKKEPVQGGQDIILERQEETVAQGLHPSCGYIEMA